MLTCEHEVQVSPGRRVFGETEVDCLVRRSKALRNRGNLREGVRNQGAGPKFGSRMTQWEPLKIPE